MSVSYELRMKALRSRGYLDAKDGKPIDAFPEGPESARAAYEMGWREGRNAAALMGEAA